jgi:hypothetical protein
MAPRLDRYASVFPAIMQLASRHGLVCFDPQNFKVHLPEDLKPNRAAAQAKSSQTRMILTLLTSRFLRWLLGQESVPKSSLTMTILVASCTCVCLGQLQLCAPYRLVFVERRLRLATLTKKWVS